MIRFLNSFISEPSRLSTLVASGKVISFLCEHGIFFIKIDSLFKVNMKQPAYFADYLNISHVDLESDALFGLMLPCFYL